MPQNDESRGPSQKFRDVLADTSTERILPKGLRGSRNSMSTSSTSRTRVPSGRGVRVQTNYGSRIMSLRIVQFGTSMSSKASEGAILGHG